MTGERIVYDGEMVVYFDAFLCKTLNVIELGPDDFGLYASGRRNYFGTTLAMRGPEAAVRAEYERCRL